MDDRKPSLVQIGGLCKSYGDLRALSDVSFRVDRGETLAYLGPNGAGKTTTINVLCGLLPRDSGEVSICGLDVERDPVAVKQRIGVAPEESNLYPELTCRRNLEYLGELYGLERAARRRRAAELLDEFDLAEKGGTPFRVLSRGMKRRLTVAAALIHSPEVVFLDEPTAGLDVPSARGLRSLIETFREGGTTVFLTTHNLAEAEALADRLIILVKGRIVAEGTAADIRRRVEEHRGIRVAFSGAVSADALRAACRSVLAATPSEEGWRLEVADFHDAAAELVAFAGKEGVRIEELSSEGQSLEDAFMSILDGGADGGGSR
jgi:ABC-2 type transport system ATP-binding protein